MKWFPQEKQRIDLIGLATRKETNPWLEKLYLVFGVLFFGLVIYNIFFAD